MKKAVLFLCVCFVFTLPGCDLHFGEGSKANENPELYDQPDRYFDAPHKSLTYIAAIKLGLSEERAAIMREAAIDPDYNLDVLKVKHAYLLNSSLEHTYGLADSAFEDNIQGSPDFSHSAKYYYTRDEISDGDYKLGYSCHYIEDVSLFLHSSADSPLNMRYWFNANHHYFEKWISNNWYNGHNFSAVANSVPKEDYYDFQSLYDSDISKAVVALAKKSNVYTNFGNIKEHFAAWKKDCIIVTPTTEAGTCPQFVPYMNYVVEEAMKYVGGAIKYTLDTYDAWGDNTVPETKVTRVTLSTTTTGHWLAGTDGKIYFTLYNKDGSKIIDNKRMNNPFPVNDFVPNQTDQFTFTISPTNLSDFGTIKLQTASTDGWQISSLAIVINGTRTAYRKNNINYWLDKPDTPIYTIKNPSYN